MGIIYGVGLDEPSNNVIFIKDVLYLFAGNEDFETETLKKDQSPIEDVYILDLGKTDDDESGVFIGLGENGNRPTWEKISPSGRAPGVLSNISLAEANGLIYVFGSSEGKSVLWVYNISKECEGGRILIIFDKR